VAQPLHHAHAPLIQALFMIALPQVLLFGPALGRSAPRQTQTWTVLGPSIQTSGIIQLTIGPTALHPMDQGWDRQLAFHIGLSLALTIAPKLQTKPMLSHRALLVTTLTTTPLGGVRSQVAGWIHALATPMTSRSALGSRRQMATPSTTHMGIAVERILSRQLCAQLERLRRAVK